MTEIYAPTRKQFEDFLPNYEMIRRFEMLFRMVGEDLPDAISNSNESANAGINNLLGLFSALSQETAVNDAAIEAKVNTALDQIALILREKDEDEFLMQTMSLLC